MAAHAPRPKARYRILRMITWLPQGGIERKIVAVLPKLNRELFDVHLCCIRERGALADDLERQGVPVHLVPFKSRLDPLGIYRLRALTRRLGIDLIHSHMYRANTPATALKILNPKLTVIGHYHNVNTWESPRQLRMDRFMAQRRNMNVAVSEAVRQNVVDTLAIPEELTTTLYNCVDLDEFRRLPAHHRINARAELGVATSEKVIIMVARMVSQKNHQLVMETAPEILRACPRARFLFVGGGPDEEALKAQAAASGIAERCIFLGRRDDVPRLLGASDVAILPSFKEGFSNAVLEAMACGLPVVASDVGGNGEIIENGINGYLLETAPDPGSRFGVSIPVAQFPRLLKRLLTDDEHRRRLGEAAWQRARHYGIDAMVSEIEQLYLEVLEGANGQR
jgi:glycosyltransferase involved in cell wall biosynthesis